MITRHEKTVKLTGHTETQFRPGNWQILKVIKSSVGRTGTLRFHLWDPELLLPAYFSTSTVEHANILLIVIQLLDKETGTRTFRRTL